MWKKDIIWFHSLFIVSKANKIEQKVDYMGSLWL